MFTNVMYTTIYVSDQERALTFYRDQLGLEIRVDYPGPDGRFLTVAVPGSPLEIILWPHAAAAGQPAEVQPGGTPGLLFLESDDLHAAFEVLRDRGVTFAEAEPEDYQFGVRIEAMDPDGNRISLRQRAAWQKRDDD
ncbi:VOC family protein [Streptomyces sp. NPDC059063]|uniref:VOC family protein n=1 Tax=unclassified Streptomyces TaxID=2593676 RepID=UPI0036842172